MREERDKIWGKRGRKVKYRSKDETETSVNVSAKSTSVYSLQYTTLYLEYSSQNQMV